MTAPINTEESSSQCGFPFCSCAKKGVCAHAVTQTTPSTSAQGPSRFRKKPVVIEAWQWDGVSTAPERPGWLTGKVKADHNEQTLSIATLEGTMVATVGDWIIRGVKGEVYPCKPDIFAATYEPASPSTAASDGSPSGVDAVRGRLRAAVLRGTADEVAGLPNGNIITKGCEAAEYCDPEDATGAFVDAIVDEVLASLASATPAPTPTPVTKAYLWRLGNAADLLGRLGYPETAEGLREAAIALATPAPTSGGEDGGEATRACPSLDGLAPPPPHRE